MQRTFDFLNNLKSWRLPFAKLVQIIFLPFGSTTSCVFDVFVEHSYVVLSIGALWIASSAKASSQ